MKLKNKEIMDITNILQSLGNKTSDIKERWALAMMCEPYLHAQELIKNETNKLVSEQGERDEQGIKTLRTDNEDYVSLLGCDSSIKAHSIPLESFANFNLQINELIALKPIIKAGD